MHLVPFSPKSLFPPFPYAYTRLDWPSGIPATFLWANVPFGPTHLSFVFLGGSDQPIKQEDWLIGFFCVFFLIGTGLAQSHL